MKLVDGQKLAKKIEARLKRSKNKGGLGVILVGQNPESHLYVKLKERAASRAGIYFEKHLYPEKAKENEILKKIKELNINKKITGIIVQLPLPKNLNTDKIIKTINPEKDADGYHPENIKKFQNGIFPFLPPVLGAVAEILNSVKSNWKKKKIILVSNSKIFPLPFKSFFGKNLSVCKFRDIKEYLPKADIIITAIGKKQYLKSGFIKKGAGIIDVGIKRENKKIYGDADPVSLAKKAAWLTPVPGGVGPLTVACLLNNTIKK
ncbi:MAG: bifunctional 5,10-methylenetetrahydrofolate dehydrogenase/5,10-methenyltetrahydrofolate cyclohydrolase [Patescibacteria group bacterium]